MKTVILKEDTVIDGIVRVRGEWVNVDDAYDTNVKRVVSETNPKRVEEIRADEIGKIETEQKEREEKEKAAPKYVAIKIDGQGAVNLDPEQSEYAHGDVIVFFAEADKGWTFKEWEFIVENLKPQTTSDNPTKWSITQDVTIVAHFTNDNLIETPVDKVGDTPIDNKGNGKNGKSK